MNALATVGLIVAVVAAWALVVTAGELWGEGRRRGAAATALLALLATCVVVGLGRHLGEVTHDEQRRQVDACVDAGGHPALDRRASVYCSYGERAGGTPPDVPVPVG